MRVDVKIQGEGKPILFLPGVGGIYHDSYNTFLKKLRHNYKVIDILYPGFGEKPALKQASLKSYTNCILEAIEELGLDKFLLVGHSLGGTMSLLLHKAIPNKIYSTIAISPAVAFQDSLFKYLVVSYKEAQESNSILKQKGLPIPPTIFRISTLKHIKGLLGLKDLLKDLQKNNLTVYDQTKPLFILLGSQDDLLGYKAQLNAVNQIEGVEVVTYPDEGHYLIQQLPDEVAGFIHRVYPS